MSLMSTIYVTQVARHARVWQFSSFYFIANDSMAKLRERGRLATQKTILFSAQTCLYPLDRITNIFNTGG